MEKEKIMREKMFSGRIYDPLDGALLKEQLAHIQLVNLFNKTSTSPLGMARRARLLKKMFAEIGEGCYIEPPLHSNWGAYHVHFGDKVYANFNLTLVDDGEIFVGEGTLMGPNVTLCTATHPIHEAIRKDGIQYNLSVHIGRHCWLGAGVTVLPGVTIGDNTVVGAGSLVTKDLPSNVVAVGSPCKVLRQITDEDKLTYNHGTPIPEEFR